MCISVNRLIEGSVSNKKIWKTENVADKLYFVYPWHLNNRDISCIMIVAMVSNCLGAGWWGIYYSDVIMSAIAFQITGVWIVYSTVRSGADQRKHQSFTSLAFVRGIHQWHKGFVSGNCFHLMTSSWIILFLIILSITNYYITRKVCWGEILLCTNHLNASKCSVVPLLIECSGHGVIDNPITKWAWFQHNFLGASETM